MNSEKILIIDDETDMLESCSRILERNNYRCITTDKPLEAVELFSAEHPALVLTDLKMPKKDGMMILRELRDIDPKVLVILFTAYSSVQTAVDAMKDGAFDFIPKPFSADQLVVTVERAMKQKRLEKENLCLRTQIDATYGMDRIIGTSEAINKVFELIKKVAKTDANILIYGESGTGKELTARSIHANSNRRDKAFVPVDCVALSENILESELFGHEKGAFTGAHAAKTGLLELAHEGTFFLDEIGKINLAIQAKLLRVLQEKEFRRVGGRDLISVDFRVISTTNIDLNKAISEEKFIEDLFWRLNVITIEMPPLRERSEDIELLANHFVKQFSTKSKKDIKGISREAMDILRGYKWPGNVRELQNVIERATSLTDSQYITHLDLHENILENAASVTYMKNLPFKSAKRKWLESFEKKYFFDLIRDANGNISHAAQTAGIDRKTIYRMIKRYNLDFNSSRE